MPREGAWSLDDPEPSWATQAPQNVEGSESEDPTWQEPAFTWSRGAIELSVAAGLLLIAAVLTAVTGSMAWGHAEAEGFRADLDLEGARLDGTPIELEWTNKLLDDLEGIGQVRIAGTLHTVGTISLFVGAGVVVVSVFLRTANLTGLGAIFTTIAVLLLLTATIMFPDGVSKGQEDLNTQLDAAGMPTFPDAIQWGAGLGLAWTGVVLGLLGIGAGFIAIRHPDVS